MGRAGDRVFRNAFGRGKEAADKITVVAGRGNHYREGIQRRDGGEVGLKIAHLIGAVHDDQAVPGLSHLANGQIQRPGKRGDVSERVGRP